MPTYSTWNSKELEKVAPFSGIMQVFEVNSPFTRIQIEPERKWGKKLLLEKKYQDMFT